MTQKLIKNSIRCKVCGIVLTSKYRHDFVSCPCGVFTDGGLDYVRWGHPVPGGFDDWIEDLSEYKEK